MQQLLFSAAIEWIGNSKQRTYTPWRDADANANPATPEQAPTMSKELERIISTVTFDNRHTSVPAIFRGGVDGVFPFATQSNRYYAASTFISLLTSLTSTASAP